MVFMMPAAPQTTFSGAPIDDSQFYNQRPGGLHDGARRAAPHPRQEQPRDWSHALQQPGNGVAWPSNRASSPQPSVPGQAQQLPGPWPVPSAQLPAQQDSPGRSLNAQQASAEAGVVSGQGNSAPGQGRAHHGQPWAAAAAVQSAASHHSISISYRSSQQDPQSSANTVPQVPGQQITNTGSHSAQHHVQMGSRQVPTAGAHMTGGAGQAPMTPFQAAQWQQIQGMLAHHRKQV